MTDTLVHDLNATIVIILAAALTVIAFLEFRECQTVRRWYMLLACIAGVITMLAFMGALLHVFEGGIVPPALGRPAVIVLVSTLLYDIIYTHKTKRGC